MQFVTWKVFVSVFAFAENGLQYSICLGMSQLVCYPSQSLNSVKVGLFRNGQMSRDVKGDEQLDDYILMFWAP